MLTPLEAMLDNRNDEAADFFQEFEDALMFDSRENVEVDFGFREPWE